MRTTLKVLLWSGLSAVFLTVALVSTSFFLILAHQSDRAVLPADCALVFGTAVYGQSSPGPAMERRIDGASTLWNDGQVRLLILTGGKGDGMRLSEATVMRQEAIRRGVDGRNILTEENARSTKQNLEFSKSIVDEHCTSTVAISDRYHLARIRLLALRMRWDDLQYQGVGEISTGGEWRAIRRELAAYLYYALGFDTYFDIETYDDVPSQLQWWSY